MIGAINPIVVAPAPRAMLNHAAAEVHTIKGKWMLFIPVTMPDGLISVSKGEQQHHTEGNSR